MTTTTDDVTDADAWRIVISDILDVTALVIDRLDEDTRDKFSRAIADEAGDYHGAEDLAHQARTALNHLDRIN